MRSIGNPNAPRVCTAVLVAKVLTAAAAVQVAACICLFALDKHEAIPVDTHVWQVATRYYTPNLKGKTLNKQARAVCRPVACF